MTPAGINELIKRSSMHILMSYLFLLTSLAPLKLMALMYQTILERLARKFSDARPPSFQEKINDVIKKTRFRETRINGTTRLKDRTSIKIATKLSKFLMRLPRDASGSPSPLPPPRIGSAGSAPVSYSESIASENRYSLDIVHQ